MSKLGLTPKDNELRMQVGFTLTHEANHQLIASDKDGNWKCPMETLGELLALVRQDEREGWRYVKELETEVERLQEVLTKPKQDHFRRLIRIMGTFDLATGHAEGWDDLLDSLETELHDVLGHLRTARRWVDLTTAEINAVYIADRDNYYSDIEHADVIMIARAIEAKLKEKNGGDTHNTNMD